MATANDFLGKGWTFPPAFDADLHEVLMTEKVEDIERSLHILLSTRVGERIMQPKFGCNMDDMVFEALSTTVITLMEDKIKTAILYFEPRIEVEKVFVDINNVLEGIILISIDYVVRATNSRFNFVFPYYKNEGTELAFITTNQGTI